ncbi:DNA polymerase III subunit alpha [Mycoplasmopsis phocirhinis]|uniref:DNA-directed DNA polymerase n=1 Tax=Mycoplasmopsis phocirhinis TaxID=142650 RepID=A0A4V0ZAD8_9BACT|nr:DNA polymerase III subunit alpha [Mycoplasmopsis phocirhinis]QBF34352.1 DNA polymerase III subunit alpha [Mycoplasmopsis phocirhinis]
MNKFINLYNTTEYTFLDSLIRVKTLVEQSKNAGLKAVVLSDHNNMFGLGLFLDICKKNNIKPVVGLDLDVDKYRFILLARNYQGFQKLNDLVLQKSKNHTISMFDIDNSDLIIIDHPLYGYYAQNLQIYKFKNAQYYVNSLDINIKNAIYIKQNQLFNKNDVDTLNLLQELGNNLVTKPDLDYFETPHLSEQILQRINNIIDDCNFELPKKQLNLAKFDNNNSFDNEKKLIELLNAGIERVRSELPKNINDWKPRLSYEFEIIKSLGFIDYFLIIQDLVNWAKSQGISIGPGRGSAAGSLISYLLNITSINPLKYDLLFERFLNPQRVSWPDIDIDIQDDRRMEVFEYLKNKYGFDRVSFISTFQTLGAKMAIRDVGRMLKIPLNDINIISKTLSANETLTEAIVKNVAFRNQIEQYPLLLKHAMKIEGLPRQQSYHPAGLIIAQENLTNYAPVSLSNDGIYQQVQLPMDYVEDFGLLKIDLLGLKTLTEIQNMEQLIDKNHWFENLLKKPEHKEIINDQNVFKNLNDGLTEGLFQLESPGMKKTISKVKLNLFEDLYAIISLFRPGPMAYITTYANNKQNPSLIQSIHPVYDQILSSTYGIMVYQEQIMLIAQKVANMSFVEADFLRRAISKKDEQKIKQYKQKFIDGALQNGLNQSQVYKIYSNIERFAEYGFNKSHAVSYAFLTMKMAFYKTYYPLIFYSALISNSRGSQTKINQYALEIRKQNKIVNSPCILNSSVNTVIKNEQIWLPFDIIKGFGGESVNKIINNINELGPFSKNLNETILRLRFGGLTENAIDILVRANVFREYGHMNFVLKQSRIMLDSFKSASKITDWNTLKAKFEKMGNFDYLVENIERDIAFEVKNEEELLGMSYNAFDTSRFEKEGDVKLNSIPLNYSEWVIVKVEQIKKINLKPYFIVELSDSTLKQSFFINIAKWDEWSNVKKNDLLNVKISNNNSKLKIITFKGI